jgi:hypothetical protein
MYAQTENYTHEILRDLHLRGVSRKDLQVFFNILKIKRRFLTIKVIVKGWCLPFVFFSYDYLVTP